MYTRCLFCAADLGRNDALEAMPVGARLAYDKNRGRLWVVCSRCARWNLTPIDDRWDVIEECERLYRGTRVRVATAEVGLAQLASGLELVRIGQPLRPEFAAWRYGRQFLSRQYRKPLLAAGRVTLIGLGPVLTFVFGPAAALAWCGLTAAAALGLRRLPAAILPTEGADLRLSFTQLRQVALVRDEESGEGWALQVDHLPDEKAPFTMLRRRRVDPAAVTLTGASARQAAATLLPRLNSVGGDSGTIADAVQWLEASGGPQRAFEVIARSPLVRPPLHAHPMSLASLHDGARLALEMALHEEEERRHLDGELSILTWMWRREEHLAEIADQLGLPEWLEGRLGELRRLAPQQAIGRASIRPQ